MPDQSRLPTQISVPTIRSVQCDRPPQYVARPLDLPPESSRVSKRPVALANLFVKPMTKLRDRTKIFANTAPQEVSIFGAS